MALTEESTSRFIKAGELNIHYHEAGSGKPLVFVHGSGPGATGWSNFARNLDYFSQHFRVIALDLPLFGRSDKPDIDRKQVYTYYANVLRDFLDALKIEKASFVGNSLGGGISMVFAMDFPNRVDRLALMGPGGGVNVFTPSPSEGIKNLLNYYKAPGPTREKLRAFLDGMVYDSAELTEELIEERFRSSTQPEVLANPLFSWQNMPGQQPIFHRLPQIKQKTLLIWGRDDRTVPFDGAFLLLKLLPDVRLHIFGKCGHWTQWEKPGEFNRLVHDFLVND